MTEPNRDGSARPVLRVVELAQDTAGAACGRLFAALGHEVTKVEPPTGDRLRHQPPCDDAGLGFTFAVLNADKRSVVADFATEADRVAVEGLLAEADVVLTDFLPSRTEGTHHVDPSALSARGIWERRPELVVVSITPFGLDRAWAERPGDSLLAEAYGGLASMIGEPDERPLSLGGDQAAHAAAFAGFFGAMIALKEFERYGIGDLVDVALCDIAAYIDWKSDITRSLGQPEPMRTGTSSGAWRMVRAADGWLGVIFQSEQWDAIVELIGDERLADPRLADEAGRGELADQWWPAIQQWARSLPKQVAYDRAQSAGLAFGFDADIADLCRSAQYRARGFVGERGTRSSGEGPGILVGPLVHSPKLRWRSGRAPRLGEHRSFTPWDGAPGRLRSAPSGATPDSASPARILDGRRSRPLEAVSHAPLAGVVVLDLGTITAGASTSRLLADYGATVVKIESESHPDSFRHWSVTGSPTSGDTRSPVSPMFESNNAGKLSIVLDLKSPEGQQHMRRLVRKAHVLVENFRVGVTERLDIDFPRLHELNQDLVYLSLSSQGQDGPAARSRSYGSTLDLLSGLASVTGYDSGCPIWSSVDVNYPDQLVSLLGAGLVAYCLERGIHGVHLDVAQGEVVSWTLADKIAAYRATGIVPGPTGNHRPGRAPHEIYRCGDGRWVAVSCTSDAERAALSDVLRLDSAGRPLQWWKDNEGMVDAAVAAWVLDRSRARCVDELTNAGVPCAPVLSATERATEPHFIERRVFLEGPPRLRGFPFVLDRYQPPRPGPAPVLGEHTATVLGFEIGTQQEGLLDR